MQCKMGVRRGMPDISNLKQLSEPLNIGVDYLLDDGESLIYR